MTHNLFHETKGRPQPSTQAWSDGRPIYSITNKFIFRVSSLFIKDGQAKPICQSMQQDGEDIDRHFIHMLCGTLRENYDLFIKYRYMNYCIQWQGAIRVFKK